MELIIAIVLITAGAFGGIYLSNRMSKKSESLDPDRGLPEPTKYPPMPKVKTQIPPKAPPPPKSEVRFESRLPKRPPPPPPPPPIRMVQSHTGREIPQPIQPVDDGFATSMALGALTGSAALGYLAGGHLVGALVGSSFTDDDAPSKKVTETYSTPVEFEPIPSTTSWSTTCRDDDSSYKSSSSSDSGSSWGSSDSSSDSSSSWNND